MHYQERPNGFSFFFVLFSLSLSKPDKQPQQLQSCPLSAHLCLFNLLFFFFVYIFALTCSFAIIILQQ